MAKLRRASAYARIERPYTRKSKKKAKNYIRGNPGSKIILFDMGNRQHAQEFPIIIKLISKDNIQIRHNALESARIGVNKILNDRIGVNNYYFKIRLHPHHMLRENPLAAGAGADRMSTGMAHSFGKVIGLAAQVKVGQNMMEVATTDKYVLIAKEALNQARYKFPSRGQIVIEKRQQ